ncbi:ATP-binding protein [uncultured Parasutterella sp.]|uniref:sensor histidine kinase n=2 Tax=uncultured Parasutterella sp. TaxID=1263098 RepID=UPI0025B70CD8|nr:ATP-binding protein [uncultured Parasutterella sp.]
MNRHLWFFVGGFIAMLCPTITAVCCWLLARKRGNDLQLAMVREQKLQQEAIAANEKMNSLQKLWAVGELSAIIAHELRQPLTSINCLSRGLIRLMERDCLNEETMKDSLLHINKLALTVSRIVEKVRGYAKKPVSQKERIDVAAYAQKVLDDSSVSTKGIYKITCNLEPSFVMADPVELELILANLVKNAIEASQESSVPKISFSVRNNGNSEVEIHISNNGAKLTEDQVNNLTTPFNSSKKDGLGLGLSIVRAVIESHKGHLDFNHQAEGLEVIITLPAAGEIEDGSTAD